MKENVLWIHCIGDDIIVLLKWDLLWKWEEMFRKSFLFIMWWNWRWTEPAAPLGPWAANTSDTPRTTGSTWKNQSKSITCSWWPLALITSNRDVLPWTPCGKGVSKKPTIHKGLNISQRPYFVYSLAKGISMLQCALSTLLIFWMLKK